MMLAIGVSATLCLTSLARAQAHGEHGMAEDAQGIIELRVIGNSLTFESVRATITAQAFAPKALRWLRAPRFDSNELTRENRENTAVLIRCWLDFSEPDRARLYFADRDAARFLIRDLELSGGLDELGREALSQALELSIRALLEDREAGLTREEARSLLTPPPKSATAETITPKSDTPPLPPRAVRRGLAGSVFWQLGKHSSELGWTHGPGVALAYQAPVARLRGELWLSGQYQLEQSYQSDRVGVSLSSVALRTGAELTWPFDPKWFVGARLGGGLDLTHFTPEVGSGDGSAALTPARSMTLPMLSSALLLGTELSSRLRLTLGALADVALTRAHYDFQEDGERKRAVDTWPVRPGLALGLTLH
jgi:hypothetical protein